ncbi:hypothetical protein Bealeia1_01231 [Candidatus Bealeia paramacronuclearis]|uniref:Uncharacterized protein n=1 Tax=Candidatus Bealeia paramacronuclearis TaxID=1921001 RepID=A0ABZ2C6P3_9PROT|nr:hypothetical protein [Candidatus Bealeia paramacronuclearis]
MSGNFIKTLSLAVALSSIGLTSSISAQPVPVTKKPCDVYKDCKYDAKELYDVCTYVEKKHPEECRKIYDALTDACFHMGQHFNCMLDK